MNNPSPQPRHRFRDTALASGLVDEGQLSAAERHVGVSLKHRATDPEVWDRAVADHLVAQGLLTPFQARELLAGRRIFRLGQYTVLDEIGKGGMGQVFRAEHAMMGREVAVKVLPRAKSTPESEAAFRREMRMLGRLDHENLVRAFDAGYDARVSYLVTELVPGVDLRRYVQMHGPLDEATAASVISQAARGLAYAHEQGLVHRDVKPGNILVMPDGRVKVLDLGLAGSQLAEESSRIGRVVGTMDYIAPEQIRTPDDVGPAADVYALGCTLYYAVTGRVPFPGGSRREKMERHLNDAPDSVRRLAPHLSDAFCEVVEAMMMKAPAERIATAKEVVERLCPWIPEGQTWNAAGIQAINGTGSSGGERSSVSGVSLGGTSVSGLSDSVAWSPAGLGGSVLVAADTVGLTRWAGLAAQSLMIAVPGGIAFGWAMGVVRSIDAGRFDSLVGGTTPGSMGWAAFLLLFVLQVVAGAANRRGR
ncbi:MAG: serine/threonine-protein kinase [Pirellulales bacterium]